MGNNINAVVSAGFVWVENAEGLIQVTKERLNLSTVPTVVVPIDEEYLKQVAFAVGAESSDHIIVSVQVNSILGNAVTGKQLIHVWLSDTASGDLVVSAPAGGATWATGQMLGSAVVANKQWDVITTAVGAASIDIVHATGAKDMFLNVEIGERVWTSDVISFAA